MANMLARVRVIIDTPFDFDLKGPDETGHDESRVNAAKHAEEHVVQRIRGLLAGYGDIYDIFVEEVRES